MFQLLDCFIKCCALFQNLPLNGIVGHAEYVHSSKDKLSTLTDSCRYLPNASPPYIGSLPAAPGRTVAIWRGHIGNYRYCLDILIISLL